MGSDEVDVKPAPSTCDLAPVDNSPRAASGVAGGRLKQSRYEDVWPEDVHAAFMEAIALYPPMGKQRLKYYRLSTHDRDGHCSSDASQAKSFGRCQLIQSYILEKTGKNRSRKQVSSHLQRLKKIHKDNPAMRSLFSECARSPSENRSAPQAKTRSPQDIFTNISFSTRHLKSDFDFTLNLQNSDSNADSSSTFTYASQTSSFNHDSYNAFDLGTNFCNQSSIFSSGSHDLLSPQQQCLPGTLHPSGFDCLSDLPDPLLFTDAINGIRTCPTFNTSAFSISMRRLPTKIPVQGRQMDSASTTYVSRETHSPGFQPTYQWPPHNALMDSVPKNSLGLHPALHMPSQQLQPAPLVRRRLDDDPACDSKWPQAPDVLGRREGLFDELHFRYPTTMCHYNSTYPAMKVDFPESPCSSSESEILRLPRGTSYSYEVCTSSESLGNWLEHLQVTSPPLASPTPVYPMSYVHPSSHLSDEYTPAPSPSWNIN